MFSGKLACSRQLPECLLKVAAQRCLVTAIPEMPPCDFVPEPYKGPPYDEMCRIRRENYNPAIKPLYKSPLLLHKGHKQWLFDHENRRYLDMFAGIVTVAVGHSHPKVVDAIQKQAADLTHTSGFFLNASKHAYVDKLISKLPGDLKNVYLTNSGTEAVELALLMARLHTGTSDVVSLRGAYHGVNIHGLTAMGPWRHNMPGGNYQHTMCPDPYRGPWGGNKCRDSVCQPDRHCDCAQGQCQAGDMYLEQVDDVIRSSLVKGRVAGFIAEPIQGANGSVQYPKNFLKGVYEKIRTRGGVCIADEVQTGFGRTGTHFWGFQGHDVMPDIVTMAKGIANGMPLAAVVTTPEIAKSLDNALHLNTFGGNPICTAAASAVLDVIEEEKLQENAHEVGSYFLREMDKLKAEFEVVGDVRGKGLMTGVELVKNQKTREPIDPEQTMAIVEKCKDLGMIIGAGGMFKSVLRIKPPLCVTKADTDFAVACLRKSIAEL